MSRSPAGVSAALLLVAAAGFIVYPHESIRTGVRAAIVSVAGVMLFLHCLRPELRREMAHRSLAIVFTMPILAWSLSNVWLLYAFACIWVPLFAPRTSQVAPVYLLSVLLLPGLDTSTWLAGTKLVDICVLDGIALGAATAIWLSPTKGKPGARYDVAVLSVIFLIGAALSRETTASNFLRTATNVVLDLGLPYYILSRGVRTTEELRSAMLWLACGSVALATILFYEAWRAWPMYNELYALYQLPTDLLVKARGGLMRASGPFVEPTSAALVLAMCLLALWLSRDCFRSAMMHRLVVAVGIAGLAAPQSRGAWIGFCLALVAADAIQGRTGALVKKLGVVGIGGTLLLLTAQLSPEWSETLGMSGGSSDTTEYRRKLFDRGMEEFWHSPLIGFPVPELHWRLADMVQGEGIIDFVNTYLWILLISGAVGIVIFVGTFVVMLGGLWRIRRRLRADAQRIQAAAFAFAVLAMLMEMLVFTSFGGRPAFLLFGMFGFATALLSQRRPAPVPKLDDEPALEPRGLVPAPA